MAPPDLPWGMGKGDAVAFPTLGQFFAVISDKGKWKLQKPPRDCPQAGPVLTTSMPDKDVLLPVKGADRQQGCSRWVTSQVLLVSLTYTTPLTLQKKAAHAQCPWPEAEMV